MEKSPNIKIFVIHFNNPEFIYEDDVFIPIQAWKKNSKIDLWILWDDTWDNISEKNSSYAELTAQYRVWKNFDLFNVDYIGFCHYRRYMTYYYRPNFFGYLFAKNFYSSTENRNPFTWRFSSLKEYNYLTKFNRDKLKHNTKNIKSFIKNNQFDVYTPKREVFIIWKLLTFLWMNCWSTECFGFLHEWELKQMCENLFISMYPEYSNIWDDVIQEGKKYYPLHRHIFIMKKDLFNLYAKYMFDYLFTLENKIKALNLDVSNVYWDNKRFMWTLAECLINYWLHYMRKKYDIEILSKANKIMFTEYYI